MIRVALIALVLAGCSMMPETPPAPSTTLADFELTDYQPEAVEPMPDVEIPSPVMSDDGEPYWRISFETMERINAALAVGHANTQALVERIDQGRGMHLTTEALLRAGQHAEQQATLYHELYTNERRQGWFDGMACKAVTSGAMLLFAVGSL